MSQARFSNGSYTVDVREDASLRIAADDSPGRRFEPRFVLLSRDEDPELDFRRSSLDWVDYSVVTWKHDDGDATLSETGADRVGDGWDQNVYDGETADRTADVFAAGECQYLDDPAVRVRDGEIQWIFERDSGSLTATVTLPTDGSEPTLSTTFEANREGWFSVGYVGAPGSDPDDVVDSWQPLVWTDGRFPEHSHLTLTYRCPLPMTAVDDGDATYGVCATADEVPFQPLPRPENSRFGVALRDQAGNARPMLFGPVLGGDRSEMTPGDCQTFDCRLVVSEDGVTELHETLAREEFEFERYRTNALASTNETVENMLEYGLSAYSSFNDRYRGSEYSTDVPGAVKNVSALHPLSVAVVTDDQTVFESRAMPMIEAGLSRESFPWAPDPEVTGQGTDWQIDGPAAPSSELAALDAFSGNAMPELSDLAAETAEQWWDWLELFRTTGDPGHLSRAVELADKWLAEDGSSGISTPLKTENRDSFGFFTDYAPWIQLFDLYDATGEDRFLDAAVDGAREYAQFVHLCPKIPDEPVTVNKGDEAPVYWYLSDRTEGPITIPEETVPAWRVSEVGLTPESTGTSQGHRGIFLANPAPWLVRIGAVADDDFLVDIGVSAVVGRYANFPGYHMNTRRTTVYEKPDYPLRPFERLSYNSFHYNHIWPQIAMLIDFLVSSVHVRSNGAISFPSRYAEGYAYLQSRVYGHESGEFYGNEDVDLWMPRGAVSTDDKQIDHLSARGDNHLYIALVNRSDDRVTTTLKLDTTRVPVDPDADYEVQVWRENERTGSRTMSGGQLTLAVDGRGITAVAVENVTVEPDFQSKLQTGSPASEGVVRLDFESTTAQLLTFGDELTRGYVYLKSEPDRLEFARLHYRFDDDWRTETCETYPFEFSVPVPSDADGIEFYVEAKSRDGPHRCSEVATLQR